MSALSGPPPAERGQAVLGVQEVTIAASFQLAAARLTHLVTGGGLDGLSEAAYEGGLTLLRVGPFGAVRGLSKLVRVRFLEPVRHGATLTVPLRWEATGVTGELFPVLDADLILAPDGGDKSRLALTGSYRPPLGAAGMALDKAIMNRIATATFRSMLESLASAITDPAAHPMTGL